MERGTRNEKREEAREGEVMGRSVREGRRRGDLGGRIGPILRRLRIAPRTATTPQRPSPAAAAFPRSAWDPR